MSHSPDFNDYVPAVLHISGIPAPWICFFRKTEVLTSFADVRAIWEAKKSLLSAVTMLFAPQEAGVMSLDMLLRTFKGTYIDMASVVGLAEADPIDLVKEAFSQMMPQLIEAYSGIQVVANVNNLEKPTISLIKP